MSKRKNAVVVLATMGVIPSMAMAQSFVSFGATPAEFVYSQDFNSLPFLTQGSNDTAEVRQGQTLARQAGTNDYSTVRLVPPRLSTDVVPLATWAREVYTQSSTFSGAAVAALPALAAATATARNDLEGFTSENGYIASGGYSAVAAVSSAVLTGSTAAVFAAQSDVKLRGWTSANIATNPALFRLVVEPGGPGNSGGLKFYGPLARAALTPITNNALVIGDQVVTYTNTGTGTPNTVVQTGRSVVSVTQTGTTVAVIDTVNNPFQDRALGALGSGGNETAFGVTFRNDSNVNLDTLSLSFFSEQWRRGNTAADFSPFSYAIGTAGVGTPDVIPSTVAINNNVLGGGDFVLVPALNLRSVNTVTGTGNVDIAINGNAASNRVLISGSIALNSPWLPGQYLTLRWRDTNDVGNDDGLAVDDLTFTASGVNLAPGARELRWAGTNTPTGSAFNTTNANFTLATGGPVTVFNSADVATFDAVGATPGQVVIDAGGVAPERVRVNNTTGTYTFTGGSILANSGLSKAGAGTLVLANAQNNFGTFGLRASGGTVAFSNDGQLGVSNGQAGSVLLSGGATLEATGGGTIDSSGRSISIDGTGNTVRTTGTNLIVGSLAGQGSFTKAGTGDLQLNSLVFNGDVTLSQGNLIFNTAPSAVASLRFPTALNGNIVFNSATRLNIGNTSTTSGTTVTASTISGTGSIFADVSGAGLSTPDLANSGYVITLPIVLNRNNVVPAASFDFNIFPGFGGGANTITMSGSVSGNGGLNFRSVNTNGNGIVVIGASSTLTYTGGTTINAIGGTAGLGGSVRLGKPNALPISSALGFNTITGFVQGSSGTGFLDLNGQSQEIRGLYTGTGDAPQNSVQNARTAFGGVDSTVGSAIPTDVNLVINVPSGESYAFGGQLLRTLSVIKTGPGTQEIYGTPFVATNAGTGVVTVTPPQTSNYTGTTEVRNGLLKIRGTDNRLSPLAPLVLGNSTAGTGGRLEIVGISQEVAALRTSGSASTNEIFASPVVTTLNGIDTVTATPSTLTVRSDDFTNTARFPGTYYAGLNTTTYSGSLRDNGAPLSFTKTAVVDTAIETTPISGIGSLTLDGPIAYSGNTRVEGGRLTFKSALKPLTVNPATTLGSVTVTGSVATLVIDVPASTTTSPQVVVNATAISVVNGASLTVTPVNRTAASQQVVITNTLSIVATSSIDVLGTLDLGNGDLIAHATSESDVRGFVASWWNNGERNGRGLTSSSASLNTLTTLGVISNNDGLGNARKLSFAGQDVVASDTLVKFTYLGDTDLDGKVDTSDFARLITGIRTGLTGWWNGDTNYDGVVNGVDYANLLTAFRLQGTSLASGEGSVGGGSAPVGGQIPEPSALGLLAVPAMLLGRRRR